MTGRTVATFLCGRCVTERRREPGVLGRTVDAGDRGLIWYRNETRRANGRRPGDLRVNLRALTRGRQPDTIPVHCRYHGAGHVTSAAVVAGRGRLSVEFHSAPT